MQNHVLKIPFVFRTIGTFEYVLKYLEYPYLKIYFGFSSRRPEDVIHVIGHNGLPGGDGRDGVNSEKGAVALPGHEV